MGVGMLSESLSSLLFFSSFFYFLSASLFYLLSSSLFSFSITSSFSSSSAHLSVLYADRMRFD